MEKKDDLYQTKDIFLASFLLAHQKRLLRLNPEGKFFWFIFEDKESCEDLASSFWNGDGQVSARDFVNSFRNLKDMLFAQKWDNTATRKEVRK